MSRHRDLRLVATLSPTLALLALVVPFVPLRVLFAAPVALLLPGYAMVAAAFARRSLRPPYFGLLAIALSLALLLLGSLPLTCLPGGINAVSWAVFLVAVTLLSCWWAGRRRAAWNHAPRLPRIRFSGRGLVLIGAGLACAVAAVVLAMATLPASNALGFTQLWILPRGPAEANEFQIGVASDEQHHATYLLEIDVPDAEPIEEEFSLSPGSERLKRLQAGSLATGRISVYLRLRHDPGTVYRRVSAVIPTVRP